MRAEFALVQAGFDKMPALTPNTAIIVNAGGTALANTVGALALAGAFITSGAFNTTLVQQASISLTLPLTADTLVGRATADTLTNKTISGASNTISGIGNSALTNSSLTIGSTSIALGATVTAFSGVTLISPIFTTPSLGTPSSGSLVNCTNLPLTTGVTGNLPVTNLGSGTGAISTTFWCGDGTWKAIPGGGDALTSNPLSQFAATTSLQLKGVISDETGSGSLVFATSPTLVTPALGTPSSGVLTSCTGLPLTTGVTGSLPLANGGTGQTTKAAAFDGLSPMTTGGDIIYGGASGTATRLANGTVGQVLQSNGTTTAPSWVSLVGGGNAQTANPLSQFASTTSAQLAGVISDETGTGALVFSTSPSLVTPLLGTPNSGTLTNCTGLPVGSGISGFGTGIATFLATPTSANLAAALTDETGTGANVFANSPTLVTPALGTPSSGTLTNCTGLPNASVVGLGTAATRNVTISSSAPSGGSDGDLWFRF